MSAIADQHGVFFERNGVMESIRQYLIGVVVAGLICSIISLVVGKKGMIGTVVTLLSGLLMAMAVVGPWVNIRIDHFFSWAQDISVDADGVVDDGENMALEAYRQGIIIRTESYILEKAKALNCDLQVEVILSADSTPVPEQVRISGSISPYAKQAISTMLTDDLGIDREAQIWTG